MAFTVNDLNDLLRILREQPEWLAEVRRVVLTDELLKLPDLVRELVEAQRRTDERLAEFQQRIERQMAEFQQRIERQMAEFQQRTDQRFAELAEAQRRTDERLAEFQQRTEEQIGELKLEMDYRAKVGAIFGSRLKKPKVVDAGDMWDVLRDRLDEEEIRQIVALDLIVRGRLLPPQGEGELWLAVEVSYVVDQNDVMRAAARAALLRKAGLPAIPVAAGKRLTQGASALATESRVVLVQDGSLVGWDDALQDASGERPSAA
jgi:hypothetical protein